MVTFAEDKPLPDIMVEGNADEQLDDGWSFEVDDEWGWEVEIDGDSQSAVPNSPGGLRISLKPTVPRALSKSQESESSLISRVKSSSSFQELERAIGATLAVGLGEVDLSRKDEHVRVINGVISQKATLGKNLRMRSYNSMNRIRSDSFGSRDSETKQSHLVAAENMKAEIKPFLDEPESRALILFHSPDVASYDIKSTCKMFGSLYYFRSDFHSFGITLVCYCDLRCAVDAHRSLRSRLGRLADATPYFSVILHCMHGCDESKLCISPVPADLSETDVQAIFVRYGPLRSIQKSFNDGGVASTLTTAGTSPTLTTCDYTVEYFNMRDAKVAQAEIQASIHGIVGPGTDVYFVVFERRQEQARKDALTILHSWRVRLEEMEGGEHARSPSHRLRPVPDKASAPTPLPSIPLPMPLPAAVPPSNSTSRPKPHAPPRDTGLPPPSEPAKPSLESPAQGSVAKTSPPPPPSPANLYYPPTPHGMVPMGGPIAGMYHMVPAPYYGPGGGIYGHLPGMMHVPVQHTHTGAGTPVTGDAYGRAHYVSPAAHPYMAGAYYVPYGGTPVPVPMSAPVGGMPLSPSGSFDNLQFAMDEPPQSPYDYSQQGLGHQVYGYGYDSSRHGSRGHRGGTADRRPPHHNGGHSGGGRRGGGGHARSHGGSADPADTADYVLSPDRLGSGSEKRTTVMIRNIPNKYSQSMLLEEINAKFDGMYDFFYLPIDFKNKCNVGYAFINFLEPSTVIQFVDEFNGQRWRNFNSEKVCSISYARIQGKAAMIARFQNSSLLEKDESYKPLLFVSKGANKGAPEAFPSRQETPAVVQGSNAFGAPTGHR